MLSEEFIICYLFSSFNYIKIKVIIDQFLDMKQAAENSRTALTPAEQVSQLKIELSYLEEKRKRITALISFDFDNPNQQNPLKNHETDQEEAKHDYVGLKKECESLNQDISTIEVWISQGLNEVDYDHKIIKALRFSMPHCLSPTLLSGDEDSEKEKCIDQPSEDPKAMYPTFPLEKRIYLLSLLLQQNKMSDYYKQLGNDSDFEQLDDFKEVLQPLEKHIKRKQWDKVQQSIFETFLEGDVSRHYAMKIYLMYEEFTIMNPLLMNQAYETIKDIDAPQECFKDHKDLIDDFSSLTADQINAYIDDIPQKYGDYKSELAQIMKPFKKASIILSEPPIDPLDEQLVGYENDFVQQGGLKMA